MEQNQIVWWHFKVIGIAPCVLNNDLCVVSKGTMHESSKQHQKDVTDTATWNSSYL